jgi:hypothetical protein
MCEFRLAVFLSSIFTIWSASVYAQCTQTEQQAKFNAKPEIPVGTQKIVADTSLYASIEPTTFGELKIVKLRFASNIDGLKTTLPPLMKSEAKIPGSNCNDRYSDTGYFVRGTGGNQIDAGFDVSYSKWHCASADVPCPTWRNPGRFCRKETKNQLFDTSAHVDVTLSARLDAGSPIIDARTHTSMAHIAPKLGFLGSLFSGILGLPPGMGAIGGLVIGSNIRNRIEKEGTFARSFPAPSMDMPDLGSVRFEPKSAEFSGTAPILLNTVYSSVPLRPNTACFVKRNIVENGLPQL